MAQQPPPAAGPADPRLVLIEKTSANTTPGETIPDYLAACQHLVEERGTPAASVARTDRGELLTPRERSDGAFSWTAGRTVACGRPIGDLWSGLPGTDYLSEHWATARAEDPARFGSLEYASTNWLHVDGEPLRLPDDALLWDASRAVLSPDGSIAVVLEFVPRQPQLTLWRYDLIRGTRQAVRQVPHAVLFGELSVSADNRWLLAGSREVHLVDLKANRSVVLSNLRAASWAPWHGPSMVVAAIGPDQGPCTLLMLDLATWAGERLCVVDARVDTVTVSPRGEFAAVVNTPDLAGWVPNVVEVDPASGRYDPVLPWRLNCGTYRSTTSPQWIAVPASARPVMLESGLEAALGEPGDPPPAQPADEQWLTEFAERFSRRLALLRHDPAHPLLRAELALLARWRESHDPSAAQLTARVEAFLRMSSPHR